MDYKELLEQHEWNSPDKVCDWMNRAEEAIRELVARCKRLDEARERANEAAHQWEGRCKILETRLETAEKMVKEYQDELIPGYRKRAEKAEREAKEAQREATICRNGWKKAESERDAAVSDMEALMCNCVDGCHVCANAIVVQIEPCVRLDCELKGRKCNPKWRGAKEE